MAATAPEADMEASAAELIEIDQIGDSMVADLLAFLTNDSNRAAVTDLFGQLCVIPPERPADDSPVSGKTIVFTGTLSGMSRAEAKARAEGLNQGFGVRIRQDRFPCDRRGCRIKARKAADLGVTVLSEADWLALISS